LKPKKCTNILFYISLVLVAIFGLWFAFNLHAYIRRVFHNREILRQSEIIYGIFSFDEDVVLTARHIMNNDDIVARLTIPGTSINHAVVHGKDNEFYLYHDLLRQPNANGSIFLDYLNSPCFKNRSTIIYGHNRIDGTMFHDLQLFQEREFFEKNDSIVITTIDEKLLYEIFTVFITHIYFNYIQVNFADDYEFLALVYEMKDRAMHLRDMYITGNDRILILSTCTGIGPTGRLVVVGRQKNILTL